MTKLEHYSNCMYNLFYDLTHGIINRNYEYTISKELFDNLGGVFAIGNTIKKILEAGFEVSKRKIHIKDESSFQNQRILFYFNECDLFEKDETYYIKIILKDEFDCTGLSMAFASFYKTLKNAYLNSPMPDEAVRPWYAGVRDLYVLIQRIQNDLKTHFDAFPEKFRCEIKNGTVIHIIWKKELDGSDYRFEICPASFELYRKKDGKEEEVYHKY